MYIFLAKKAQEDEVFVLVHLITDTNSYLRILIVHYYLRGRKIYQTGGH